jgi:hypothetical protein
MIFSGVFAATSSMSMPPAAEATNAMRPVSRLSSRLRYSSRAIFEPDLDVDLVDRQALGTRLLGRQALPSIPAAARRHVADGSWRA